MSSPNAESSGPVNLQNNNIRRATCNRNQYEIGYDFVNVDGTVDIRMLGAVKLRYQA